MAISAQSESLLEIQNYQRKINRSQDGKWQSVLPMITKASCYRHFFTRTFRCHFEMVHRAALIPAKQKRFQAPNTIFGKKTFFRRPTIAQTCALLAQHKPAYAFSAYMDAGQDLKIMLKL